MDEEHDLCEYLGCQNRLDIHIGFSARFDGPDAPYDNPGVYGCPCFSCLEHVQGAINMCLANSRVQEIDYIILFDHAGHETQLEITNSQSFENEEFRLFIKYDEVIFEQK